MEQMAAGSDPQGPGGTMDREGQLGQWLAAIRAVRSALSGGLVHARLAESSIDTPRDNTAQLTDREQICTPEQARRAVRPEGQVWTLEAPEQTGLIEATVDERTNVYNLGVLGFLRLTGADPYGASREVLSRETIVRLPVDPDGLLADPSLKRIVERATAKQPAERYASVFDLETDVALRIGAGTAAAAESAADGAIVGREAEQQLLAEAITATRAGQAQTLAVIGEPGVGKTYLWQSVQDRFAQPQEVWFSFKSSQISNIPYRAVGALFDRLLAGKTAGELEGISAEAQYVLSRISRRASDLLDSSSVASADVAGAQAALPGELARVLSRLAGTAPLSVLVFDDLQWLDEQSYAVVRELSGLAAGHRLLVLIGRPEARERVPEDWVSTITLEGISREAARELLDRTVLPETSGDERRRIESRMQQLHDQSRGNPLALLTLARAALGAEPAEGRTQSLRIDAPESALLVSLALGRLTRLSVETRSLLHALALCSPPVREAYLSGIDLPVCASDHRRDAALTEARTAMLVSVSGGPPEDRLVQFSHDTIEQAVRTEARSDSTAVAAVVSMLAHEAGNTVEHAMFALARLLFPPPEELQSDDDTTAVRSLLAPEVEREVLFRAAERSVELLSPEYGLRYAEAAIRHHADSYDDARRLRLHEIAHQAAFLADDPYAMSRHFRAIRARGDSYTVNMARQLWVSYGYGSSRLAGAIRVGVVALQELGIDIALEPDGKRVEHDIQYLRKMGASRVIRKLQHLPTTEERAAVLIIRLCTRILAPVITTRPALFPSVLRTIIDVSLRFGATPDTGIAFVYWALLLGNRNGGDRKLYRLGTMAEAFAARASSDIARTTILAATRVLTTHWGIDIRTVLRECGELFDESLEVGNTEWACHAGHAHCVDRFFAGHALQDLFHGMHTTRDVMRSLGYHRAVRALSKYQQAVECLLGLAPNSLELSGTIDDEPSELKAYEREGDYIALYGMYFLRSMLALYADRPDKAYADGRSAVFADSAPKALHDYAITVFVWGMSAWRIGKISDGRIALKKLRRWAREVPVNQQHRYLLVRAEALRHGKRVRRAVRSYRRSIACAIERGYIHEAALGSERLGDLLSQIGDRVGADGALYQAHSLYSRWGAAPAAERVRKRLGWAALSSSVNPVLAEQQFVSRIVSADSRDLVLRLALSELGRLSAADESVLVAQIGDQQFQYRCLPTREPEGIVTRLKQDDVPPAVAELCAEAGDAVVLRSLADGRSAARLRCRSEGEVTVTVVLLNRAERERFSELFATRAQSVLLLAVTALGVRHLAEATSEQTINLDRARQALVSGRQKQEQLLQVLETALLLVDAEGTVLVSNPASKRYLSAGAASEPQLLPEMQTVLGTQINDAQSSGDAVTREYAWRSRQLRILVTPAQTNAVIAIDDITGMRAREQELERQRRQLIVSDRMSSLGMLAASTAHEVGNPNHILQLNLQSLRMTLEQMKTDPDRIGETSERAEAFLAEIEEASGRIEDVIRSVKEFARGGADEKPTPFDPNRIAETAVRFSRILAKQFTDRFHYTPGENLPQIAAYPGLLEQALINLIKNACEALADRTGRVELRTALDPHTGEVVFAVCDEGSGMPDPAGSFTGDAAENLPPASPFTTTKADSGGTGLGLTIVRTIVERHGGALRFLASEEFATVVEVRVPECGARSGDTGGRDS